MKAITKRVFYINNSKNTKNKNKLWVESYMDILQCPYCGGDLLLENKTNNAIICKRCKRSYKIIDGIPILLRY